MQQVNFWACFYERCTDFHPVTGRNGYGYPVQTWTEKRTAADTWCLLLKSGKVCAHEKFEQEQFQLYNWDERNTQWECEDQNSRIIDF